MNFKRLIINEWMTFTIKILCWTKMMKKINDLKSKFNEENYWRKFKLKWRWSWKTLITQVENSEECFAGINQVENRIYRLEDKVEELNHKANMKNKIHERNFKNPNIHMEAIKAPA